MQVCFIGHRQIEKNEELICSLRETVTKLIKRGFTTFLFGSKSDFDMLSWEIVTELKEEYPFIIRVYVRSSFQHVDKSYLQYLLNSYEKTYFPSKLEKAGKCSYVERNFEMIDNSNCCVFYYNEKYVPTPPTRKSGTQTAYNYARRKKKEIINLYSLT